MVGWIVESGFTGTWFYTVLYQKYLQLASFYFIGSRGHKYKIMSRGRFANVSTEKKGGSSTYETTAAEWG